MKRKLIHILVSLLIFGFLTSLILATIFKWYLYLKILFVSNGIFLIIAIWKLAALLAECIEDYFKNKDNELL